MVLDNMDGNQARRTGNSTPLGLIFDHQVDAICVTITTTFLSIISLYGNSWESLIIWVMAATPFYLATWEELYVGKQVFPVINGPSDGCLSAGILFVILGCVGPEYFHENRLYDYRYIDIIYVVSTILSVCVAIYR
jgi:ethanolaminephosphotransferase